MGIIKSYSNGLTKLLSSDVIKHTYPMIDRIEAIYYVNDLTDSASVDLYVYLNDGSINSDNMYIKDFDPHYLVDFHIRKLLSFFDLPKNTKIYTTILNPKGQEFFNFDY